MPTTPTAPTAVPDFPELSDRATYNARAYAWAVHMDDVYPAEMQALATNTYNNAMEAQADTAATAADRAQTGLDAVATAADRVQTGLDAANVATLDKRYLGAFASSPTLDNQGAALQTGAVCYNTTLSKVLTWNGSAWVEGIASVAGVSSINGLTGAVTVALPTAGATIYNALNFGGL